MLKKGETVQFKAYWGEPPSPYNTGTVTRVAKDLSWCDVKTLYGRKRIPNPMEHLKIVSDN
jgi:hypothetical protein